MHPHRKVLHIAPLTNMPNPLQFGKFTPLKVGGKVASSSIAKPSNRISPVDPLHGTGGPKLLNLNPWYPVTLPEGSAATYHGGKVLSNAHIFLVFWGNYWEAGTNPSADDVTAGMKRLLEGPYLSRLSQYKIAPPKIVQSGIYVPDPPSAVSEDDVVNFVTGMLNGGYGGIGELYLVVLPPNVTTSIRNAAGAHDVIYAVQYDPSQPNFVSKVDAAYWGFAISYQDFHPNNLFETIDTLSHEMVEALTNPDGDGWFFDNVPDKDGDAHNELADVCSDSLLYGPIDGVDAAYYWSQVDGKCVLPTEPAGDVAGTPSMIQSNVGLGNMQVVVPSSKNTLVVYEKDNSSAYFVWNDGVEFGDILAVSGNPVRSGCIAQSDLGSPGMLHVVAMCGPGISYFERDPGTLKWSAGSPATLLPVTGSASMVHRSTAPKTLDLVVPLAAGGMIHLSCSLAAQPPAPGDRAWAQVAVFGQSLGVIDEVSMIEGNGGNLELLVRRGGLLYLFEYAGGAWSPEQLVMLKEGIQTFEAVASGNIALIQRKFDGIFNTVPLNLEILSFNKEVQPTNGIQHFQRQSADPGATWNVLPSIGKGTEIDAFTATQMHTHGRFAIAARTGNQLIWFAESAIQPPNQTSPAWDGEISITVAQR